MFLVLDRATAVTPTWLQFDDAVIHHPSRLVIRRWHVEPQSEWLITGPSHLLDALVCAIVARGAAPGSVGVPGRPRLRCVTAAPPRRSWWRRLLGLRAPRLGTTRLEAWLCDLTPPEPLERLVLANIADALAADVDVVVLDRVLKYLRPEVRFRVANDVHRQAAELGTAFVVLAEHDYEGWIAVTRRAVLERGEWRDVHERPLVAATGSD